MAKMSLEQLEQLASNPFYVMSKEQLADLEEYQMQKYQPFKKHVSSFKKNVQAVNKHPNEDGTQ